MLKIRKTGIKILTLLLCMGIFISQIHVVNATYYEMTDTNDDQSDFLLI